MHKGSHSVQARTKKKLEKALQNAKRIPVAPADDMSETASKRRKLYKKLLEKAKHDVVVKKHKKHTSKQSKRTTPGEEIDEFDANSHNFHIEGGRWMKTVQKQQVDRGKKLQHRLLKKTVKR